MLSFRPFRVRVHNLLRDGTHRAGAPLHNGVEIRTMTRSHVGSLFDEGLAASTVRVYAAAISACHEGFAKKTLLTHCSGQAFSGWGV